MAGTPGAALVPELDSARVDIVTRKGRDPRFESFSAFADEGGHDTGLAEGLKRHGVRWLVIVGVATEHCVRATAMDALRLGFQVAVVVDAVAAVNEEAGAAALREMEALGAELVTAAQLNARWKRSNR